MPITELALFHLKRTPIPLSIRETLHQAQSAQSAYSTHLVHFLCRPEDQSYIYLLGGWDSVGQHVNDWIPSEMNRGFMDVLKESINMVWFGHVGVEPGVVRGVLGLGEDGEDGNLGRGFIVRCSSAGKGGLDADAIMLRLKEVDPLLPLCGGRRIDMETRREEVVLFCGREAVSFIESHDFIARGLCDEAVVQEVIEWRADNT